MDIVKKRKIEDISKQTRELLGYDTKDGLVMSDVISRLGGTITYEAIPGDVDATAMVELTGYTFVIALPVISKRDDNNFVLAHVLGHMILHQAGKEKRWIDSMFSRDVSATKYNEQEYEANQFALSFLLPRWAVKDLNNQGYTVQQIADYFGTSVLTVNSRLRNLGDYLLD
jgi:hypothetical protein